MIKYNHTKLMYPEPDDTGSGGEAVESVASESTPAEKSNVFDFDSFEESAEEPETPQSDEEETGDTDPDYELSLPDDLGLEKEEVAIFTNAAKKYGIDKEAASGMVAEVTKAINENVRQEQEAQREQAEKALREQWGERFTSNLKKAGDLVKHVGKAAGWSAELMASFKNAEAMRVFYDIARVMGSGKTVGLSAAPTAAPMSKSDLEKEIINTVTAFWNAKDKGDRAEAQRLSDKHMELQKARYGKKGTGRMLQF
jgi:hypothetical protein